MSSYPCLPPKTQTYSNGTTSLIVDANPLFVLEAQLSLLSRLSTTQVGAETLIECGVFESFGACHFLGARPASVSNIDTSQFAIANERYHQAFVPVMTLLVDIAGKTSDRGYKAASKFAQDQREVLSPFFRKEVRSSSLLALKALEIIVRFLFILADDERKLVKVSVSWLPISESILRLTIFFLTRIRNRCCYLMHRDCAPLQFNSWASTMPFLK